MVTPKNSACIYIYMPIIVFGVSIIYFVDWLVLVVLYLLNSHFLALDTKNYKNFNFYLILLSSEYFKTSPFLITHTIPRHDCGFSYVCLLVVSEMILCIVTDSYKLLFVFAKTNHWKIKSKCFHLNTHN